MSKVSRRHWLIAAAAVIAGGAGFALRRANMTGPATGDAVRSLLALELPDPDGKPQSMKQWQGRVQIVNFWATWCEPCREEIPGLLRIGKKHDSKKLQIVGIAIDSADKVKQFAKEFEISYPLLIGGLETVDLSRELGNKAGALPYTVVLDQGGKVVRTHLGKISEQELDDVVTPLLTTAQSPR
jgi:thiol-disulfide isomerase/thioredoxin